MKDITNYINETIIFRGNIKKADELKVLNMENIAEDENIYDYLLNNAPVIYKFNKSPFSSVRISSGKKGLGVSNVLLVFKLRRIGTVYTIDEITYCKDAFDSEILNELETEFNCNVISYSEHDIWSVKNKELYYTPNSEEIRQANELWKVCKQFINKNFISK